jgi:acyl-[acyl-carrier-protein] desaturase
MPPLALTNNQCRTLVERAVLALYKCYAHRLETTRNWNPDTSFEWSGLRKDHSSQFIKVIKGFYAVEQYVTDYISEFIRVFMNNYGRSKLQIRLRAEEQRHSDAWRNILLFSRACSPEELEQYTEELRSQSWIPPFNNPLCMLLYTTLQERATQSLDS